MNLTKENVIPGVTKIRSLNNAHPHRITGSILTVSDKGFIESSSGNKIWYIDVEGKEINGSVHNFEIYEDAPTSSDFNDKWVDVAHEDIESLEVNEDEIEVVLKGKYRLHYMDEDTPFDNEFALLWGPDDKDFHVIDTRDKTIQVRKLERAKLLEQGELVIYEDNECTVLGVAGEFVWIKKPDAVLPETVMLNKLKRVNGSNIKMPVTVEGLEI